ncbi:DNA repair protein RadA [candidate division KSB1 bacterium]|nr:DNA repair protein RadA [candidate division KSB1 bacterium]
MSVKKKRDRTQFICQACGFTSARWLGRCSECGEWNSMIEERIQAPATQKRSIANASSKPIPLAEIDYKDGERIKCVTGELNRVLGGGIVPGSLVLIGGDPGIGKSTLMLQEAVNLASTAFPILYVSGEESASQTKMRANRLQLNSDALYLLPETNLESIVEHIEAMNPSMIIVDSIQSMYQGELESAPGSLSQVRECALQFLTIAKSKSIPIFIIGHVTKDGYIAGPKVLEHLVDTLLFFEGDREHIYRILRTIKNRFGSTNEIGVFEMTEKGLREVPNPSEIFLSQRKEKISGSSVVCLMEGTRPILVEIQALVGPTSYGLPQRTTAGVDAKRLALLLAVLEKRVGLRMGTQDVFINVVGGVKADETSADLGIVVSIVSSLKNRAIHPKTILLGEVGLGGEIRAISKIEKRITEAEKLGFKQCIVPQANLKSLRSENRIEIVGIEKVDQALDLLTN